MRDPSRYKRAWLRREGLLSELFTWSEILPEAKYRHHNGVRRDDLEGTREYVKEWERLADTSKAKFACVDAVIESTGRVTSLWSGILPNGRELFIISIDRPPAHPHYDRGLGERDEALTYFSRFRPAAVA